MLVTIVIFSAMTTAYAQKDGHHNKYDWDNPGVNIYSKVYIRGESERGKIKVYPGEKPARFGEEDVIPAKPGDVEEVWIPLSYAGNQTDQFSLSAFLTLEKDTWKKYTVAFIPQTNGKVWIVFRDKFGSFRYKNDDFQDWVTDYKSVIYGKMEGKNVKLKGVALASENDLKAWNVTIDRKNKDLARFQPVFLKGFKAPGGRTGVEVFDQLSQIVDVKKGQQVEITFYMHPGKTFKPLK